MWGEEDISPKALYTKYVTLKDTMNAVLICTECGITSGAHKGFCKFKNDFPKPENILDKHLRDTVNKSWNYAGKAESLRDELTNAIFGVSGEVGEVADIHKKMWFHKSKDGRREELLLELGDVFYYLCKLVELSGFTFEEVLGANHDKLAARYPEMFKEGK